MQLGGFQYEQLAVKELNYITLKTKTQLFLAVSQVTKLINMF